MGPRIHPRLAALAFVVSAVAASAHAEPRARSEVIVTLAGERADSSRMEEAVESLLGLEGIVVAWERLHSAPGEGSRFVDADRAQSSAPRRVLVDVTSPTTVSILLLRAGGPTPAVRVVDARTLDEATCETIAQILRSVLLAPDALPRQAAPVPSAETVAAAGASSPAPAPRPVDLRAGYVLSTAGGDLGFLTGATVAASWATSGRAGSPIVVLSLTRSSGAFASAGAPADASFTLWSLRVGAGWERSWRTGWWLAVEGSVGPDQLNVTPASNGETGTFRVAPPQSAVRLAVRTAVRGEVALIGPALFFLQAQADLMPQAQVEVQDGSNSRRYVVENGFGASGAAGLAMRW
jgi:hypothetical protein